MATTSIEWTHPPGFAGESWNPTKGCRRKSPGCEHCYAERMAFRIVNMGGPAAQKYRLAVKHDENGKPRPRWSGKIIEDAEALSIPLRTRRPTCWFVDSMSDLFDEGVSDEFIAAIFGVMATSPQHRFLVLTKSAERMARWFEWHERQVAARDLRYERWRVCEDAAREHIPDLLAIGSEQTWPLPGVWLGVSVENQEQADKRIPHLLRTPAEVRFLSCEPLLGPLKLDLLGFGAGYPAQCRCGHGHGFTRCPNTGSVGPRCHHAGCNCSGFARQPGSWTGVDWVIVGGESGPGARPYDLAWPRSIIAQCRAAGVPAFHKQVGTRPAMDEIEWERQGGSRLISPRSEDKEMVDAGLVQLSMRNRKGGDMSEWPEDLRVREFPKMETK